MLKMEIQVYASEKVRPSFELLERLQPVKIHFTDLSLSLGQFIKNILIMAKSDMIYFHSPANLRIIILPMARLFGKPVLLQWIGTDVLNVTCEHALPVWDIGIEREIPMKEALLQGVPRFQKIMVAFTLKFTRLYINFLNKFVTHHVACASHFIPNLQKVGVESSYLPVLNFIKPELLPFPDELSVLAYIGYHSHCDNKDFYGWTSLTRLAKDFSDIKIFIVGRSVRIGYYPSNIIFLDYINDIRTILSKVKAIVRLTYHDGTPRMILEGMSTGRYIIYSHSFPYTFHVTRYEDLTTTVKKIRNINTPNIEGFNYVKTTFDYQKVSQLFVKEFEKTVNKKK